MLKIEHTDVYGFEAAIRGMRNAKNSWDRIDSYWTYIEDQETGQIARFEFFVGDNDLKLMKGLDKAGTDHAKFMRYIDVTMDITAPLYWWKEFDTYKVGTVSNSCSTMHKIHAKKFTLDDFSHEHLMPFKNEGGGHSGRIATMEKIVDQLNHARADFLFWDDKKYWWHMIQLLPASYNQKRTIKLNYQVLEAMYFARRHHKLDEWHTLCDWMEGLPYFMELIGE